MENNEYKVEYIVFFTEDEDGTRFSKWIKKSQYIRKKKLKKLKKVMKKN